MDTLVTELHRPARRRYNRRKVIVKGVNDLWQGDLVEMIPYEAQNRGYKYVLTVINCMSKYAWAVPVKNKTGKAVTEAFEKVLKSAPSPPENLQTDLGTEFYNGRFKALMKRYGINHYSTNSETKASIVERLNRTLKGLTWKRFTRQGSYEWVKILPEIVAAYNNRVHSATGKKPIEFTAKDGLIRRRLKKKV